MKFKLAAVLLTFISSFSQASDFDYATPLCVGLDDPEVFNSGAFGHYGQLIQGGDNWVFRMNNVFPELSIDPNALSMLSEINQKFAAQGITLVMVPVPYRSLIYPNMLPIELRANFQQASQQYLSYIERIKQQDIHVVNFQAMFDSSEANLFYKRDPHWRPEGAKYGAKLVSDYIRHLPVYSQLTRQQFVTNVNGIAGFNMQNNYVLKDHCNSIYPKEYHKLYETLAVIGDDEDALFAQEMAADVVLIGTSFSVTESASAAPNFSGFLSETLEANVVNHAVSGGGIVASINQYLSSDEFIQSPPKVIVWEFPLRNLKAKDFALAWTKVNQTRCGDTALETATTLKLGANLVAYNGGNNYRDLMQQQVLYEFKFANSNINKFIINTHYIEKRQFKHQVGHQRLQGHEGYFLFDQSYKKSLQYLHFLALDINVEDPEMVGTQVVTRICIKEAS